MAKIVADVKKAGMQVIEKVDGGPFLDRITSYNVCYTKLLRSQGVNVNGIAPGYMDTEMNTALKADETRSSQIMARIPAGRWGKPEDMVGAAIYLASDASDYVNGTIITVDGGWMGR